MQLCRILFYWGGTIHVFVVHILLSKAFYPFPRVASKQNGAVCLFEDPVQHQAQFALSKSIRMHSRLFCNSSRMDFYCNANFVLHSQANQLLAKLLDINIFHTIKFRGRLSLEHLFIIFTNIIVRNMSEIQIDRVVGKLHKCFRFSIERRYWRGDGCLGLPPFNTKNGPLFEEKLRMSSMRMYRLPIMTIESTFFWTRRTAFVFNT